MTTNRENPVITALANQTGRGGCDDCDAYQVMSRDPKSPGLIHLNIHHDDTCPTFHQKLAKESQ